LAVDATWVWESGEIPNDLLDVWTEMVTYYSDKNRDLKSQTLGSHSYTRFDKESPQESAENKAILEKYVGSHGSINQEIIV
jgi:hypothetical protein